MAINSEKRKFFLFFSKKNAKTICFTKKSSTFASQLSLGLWCNGNTADSGPAFPGSSPGSPTERFPFGNLFFCAFSVVPGQLESGVTRTKRDQRDQAYNFDNLKGQKRLICKVWGNLKSYPAVDFTINQLSYILFVVVLSCSFLKKNEKLGTRAHQSLTPPARELHCNSRAKVYSN